jgi:hypothetical protein
MINKRDEKLEKMKNEKDKKTDMDCHGNPNGKKLKEKDIRTPEDFMKDNLNYISKNKTKIEELKKKIVDDTDKNLPFKPFITEVFFNSLD